MLSTLCSDKKPAPGGGSGSDKRERVPQKPMVTPAVNQVLSFGMPETGVKFWFRA